MIVVVNVMVVVVMAGTGVVAGRPALTGRRKRHSTPRLAVVSTAILPLAQLDQVVRKRHAQLRGEGRVVGAPVRENGSEAGLRVGPGVRIGHLRESTTCSTRMARFARRADRRSGSGAHTWPRSDSARVGPAPIGLRPVQDDKGKDQAKPGSGALTALEAGGSPAQPGHRGHARGALAPHRGRLAF